MCLAAVDNFEARLIVQLNKVKFTNEGLLLLLLLLLWTPLLPVVCVPTAAAAAAAARSAAAAAKSAAAAEANRRRHELLLLVFARDRHAERQWANVVLDAVPRKIRCVATGGRREAGGLQQCEMHAVLACGHVQRR